VHDEHGATMRSRKPRCGQSVRVVRVHDVKPLCGQKPSQEESASSARKARRNWMYAESFGLGAACEWLASQGDEFRFVAAGTQAAQQKQDLALASTPVGTSVEMQ
jgi:hypothetical protein